MEDLTCNYHPEAPASWDCPGCGRFLCDACVVHRQEKQYGVEKRFHLCPKCNREVSWLGVGSQLEPFWKRMPGFFLYPFLPRPLLLNTLLCIITLFVTGNSLTGMLIRLAVWGVWLKYAFASLKATAMGNLNPPSISLETISDDFQDVFKQVILYALLGAVTGWVFVALGLIPGLISLGLILLLMPAMIILLVSTGSITQALNPVTVVSLPLRIGAGYLTMYFFLFLLAGAPAALFNSAGSYLPAALLPFLFVFFQNYYTLISYNLMGYVLLQYHEEIGYEVDYEDFVRSGEPEEQEGGTLLKEAEIHIKDGNYDTALKLLKDEIRTNPNPPANILDRYFKLLRHLNRFEELQEHGLAYIRRLVASEEKEKACEIYIECSQADKGFAPEPKALIKLGGWLKSAGYQREAIRAYSTFTKVYASHSMMPIVCFRAAEIFNEGFGQKKKAGTLLNSIVKKYPDHDIIPFVRNYMKRLQT